MERTSLRRTLRGIVVSDKMDKTIVVAINEKNKISHRGMALRNLVEVISGGEN